MMDSTDPTIVFDEAGICNYCNSHNKLFGTITNGGPFYSYSDLEELSDVIKARQRAKKFDVLVGLSGGVDSSYTALITERLGLRAAYVHFDSGWNSAMAAANIRKTLEHLSGTLYTHVCDWDTIKTAQRAFFKNGERNCDIPQDHAFLAALLNYAKVLGVPYVFSGHNLATEFVMPMSWGYTSHDFKYMTKITRKYEKKALDKLPKYNPYSYLLAQRTKFGLTFVHPLNYVTYDKKQIEKEMQAQFGWQGYLIKHGESKFTDFFQNYYLYEKFGIDKRKAHLASSILSGIYSRKTAIDILSQKPYDAHKIKFQTKFFCEKLGLSVDEFNQIMISTVNQNQSKRSLFLAALRKIKHRGVNYAFKETINGRLKSD